MNFFYQRRVALGFGAVILAIIFTFGICFFALARTASQTQRLTVVIDAGHGGVDGGVTGVKTGTTESSINLSVSRYLQWEFEEAGFTVVQTRRTEAGLYGTATGGFKRRDMQKRAEIIRESTPALVVSIHQNFFSLSSRRGGQVFFRSGSDTSYSLACSIQEQLNNLPQSSRKCQPLVGDYYILNCSNYPSVIVEGGFLSNAEDEALLTSTEYQKNLAAAIAKGALVFLSTATKGN